MASFFLKILFYLALIQSFVASSSAQEQSSANPPQTSQQPTKLDSLECVGVFYRAKRKEVAVFDEPSSTAKVIARLNLGEKVCYVGEDRDFAIIDAMTSPGRSKFNLEKRKESSEIERFIFVRLVDLWPPRSREQVGGLEGFVKRIKSLYYYMRSGGVPEGGFFPFETTLEPLPAGDECAKDLGPCKLP